MNKRTTSTAIPTRALKLEALSKISASFELFCLASGMEALGEMMDRDAQVICGPRHARGCDRRAHRWGKTKETWRLPGSRARAPQRRDNPGNASRVSRARAESDRQGDPDQARSP
jgi:hypothetical protein